MELVKLPQPYALRLEMIRAKGYSNEDVLELLALDSADALREKVDQEGNWDGFLDYARENRTDIRAALHNGFQFKFATMGGIKGLLKIRYGKEEGRDYRFEDAAFEELRLTAEEYAELRRFVRNWTFEELGQVPDSADVRIRIALAG